MPQMAPMNWTILYLMFLMLFIMINFLNYYIYIIKNNISKIKKLYNKTINWKW